MLHAELHQLLEPYINAPVECDGFTRLAHTALTHAGIEHTCMLGRLISADGQRKSPIHYWITLPDGQVIDYRARMWLGVSETVPHGVFFPACYKLWAYEGAAIDLPVLTPIGAQIMMMAHPTLPL